jgi:ADP-heptose:LPS heptosyltransferase
VSSLGAKVILEVQPPLVKLMDGLEGVNQIISTGDNLPDFDYQCPLLSLPLAFKTDLQTIPKFSGYIKRDQDKLARWQVQLGGKIKPRIGIVWSGRVSHKNDQNRSLTLAQLMSHLPSNYEYISLQKEIRDIDQETLTKHNEIKHFGNIVQDFTDTAALCELMDIVLSVDTSVAHLAGALGVPTWVLLPYNPDWRWLLNRDDSPWYPSMKLYRQPAINDWNSVFDRIKSDLASTL